MKTARDNGESVRRGVLGEVKKLKQLSRKLAVVADMQGEWVVEETKVYGKRAMRFSPIWPAPYAERYLFASVPKVVLFSATLRPKTAELLGISPQGHSFLEYPSDFPVAHRPVYHIPTVQMSHRTNDQGIRIWLQRIDQIIRARKDRKGIIHTVSYARRNLVMENSEFSGMMMTHGPDNTRMVIEQFKRMDKPCVLVSPSVTTGYDFPYEECEYQIIGKLPFPDTRGAVLQARVKADRDYANYITMQVMVQASGRGCRAADDRCETFIIDDNIVWFLGKNKQFAPRWWLDSMKRAPVIPPAPTKLRR
jgi:ATP-dependent DNA helicase DinG